MAARNFWDEVSANKRNSFFLLVAFIFFIILIGALFGYIILGSYVIGLIIAFIIAIIYSLIAFYSGDKIILNMSKAREVTKKEDPFLINTVEGLAIAAGIPRPKVYIIEEESPNAFATGRSPESASITITSGLRKKLNRTELEGVIAHEMSHIKNYDIRFMMLVAVLVGVVILISDIMIRSFIWSGPNRRSRSSGGGLFYLLLILIAILAAILAPLIAQVIKFAISRKREFLADANAALLTRYPQGLANALKKIRDDKDKVVDTANKSIAHLYIENPLRHKENQSWLDRLFSTHPPINERIRRLEAM